MWTYSDLTTKVQSYLSRTDLATQVDDAILLFESEYNTRKGVWRRQATATLTATAGTPTIDLPVDFERPHSLTRVGYLPVNFTSLDGAAPYRGPSNGVPVVAAVYPGDKLLLAPTPDSAYQYELIYYPRLDGLSTINPANWLVEKYPHIYLYGVLSYMQDYIRDDARKASVQAQHESNMAFLENSLTTWAEGQATMTPVQVI
jgi:hypothetical protein